VETVDDPRREGTIQEWSLGGPLRLAGTGVTTQPVPAAEISRVFVLPSAATSGASPGGRAGRRDAWRATTTDGQVLRGAIDRADDDHVALRNARLGIVAFPLDAIRTIERSSSVRRGERVESPGDRVLLANGDEVDGVVERLNADGIRIQSAEGADSRTIGWDAVERVELANEATKPVSGLSAILRLVDGSIVRADKLHWEGGTASANLVAGGSVRVPIEVIRAIEVAGGRRDWLSDLEPIAYEHRPQLGPDFPLGRDVSCLGGPLRAGGRTFDRGVGLHSACRAEWKLDRRYVRLRGLVAIDDSAGPLADATLRVIVDGREATRLERLRHGEPPRSLDVDLSKGESLVIEVDYGENADVQDRINLLDAALIRPEPRP
jgi:hypothetical protein